jgi:hypothetical protein
MQISYRIPSSGPDPTVRATAINFERASGGKVPGRGKKCQRDAREILADVVKRIELAPPYVRKTQAEWLAMARQALKV